VGLPVPYRYQLDRDEASHETLSIFNPCLPPCPFPRTHEETDLITGEIIEVPDLGVDGSPLRCGRNVCPHCAVINARRIAYAIELAEPTHSFSITLVGSHYAVIKKKMDHLIRHLRKLMPAFHWVWAVEENPNRKGCHIHGYCYLATGRRMANRTAWADALIQSGFCLRGGQIPQWTLDELEFVATADYLQYPMKSLIDSRLFGRFLYLNGPEHRRQLIHASRHFWRDRVNGRVIPTRAEAERISYHRAFVRARSTRLALLEASSVDPQPRNGSS
jgi:hypothetical protein